MFKNIDLKILFFFICLVSYSQEPVSWSTSVEKINDNNYKLVTTANIQDNWRLYSQNLEDGGALPTEFIFEDESIFESFSVVSERESITKYDPIFKMDQSYFIDETVFTQDISLKDGLKQNTIIQDLYYQVCDDRVCILQDIKLVYNLNSDDPNLVFWQSA